MRICKLVIVFLCVGISPSWSVSNTILKSTEIGNGADLVLCSKRIPGFSYDLSNGWYLLDYVETKFVNGTPYPIKKTLLEYLKMVRKIIEVTDYEKLNSFDSYIRSVPFLSFKIEKGEPFLNRDIRRVWIAKIKTPVVRDEGPSRIPKNCSRKRKGSFQQIIVRKEVQKRNFLEVRYYYNANLISKVINKPLQLSMLIVHEWLWDFYSKNRPSSYLRRVNRKFHMKETYSNEF